MTERPLPRKNIYNEGHPNLSGIDISKLELGVSNPTYQIPTNPTAVALEQTISRPKPTPEQLQANGSQVFSLVEKIAEHLARHPEDGPELKVFGQKIFTMLEGGDDAKDVEFTELEERIFQGFFSDPLKQYPMPVTTIETRKEGRLEYGRLPAFEFAVLKKSEDSTRNVIYADKRRNFLAIMDGVERRANPYDRALDIDRPTLAAQAAVRGFGQFIQENDTMQFPTPAKFREYMEQMVEQGEEAIREHAGGGNAAGLIARKVRVGGKDMVGVMMIGPAKSYELSSNNLVERSSERSGFMSDDKKAIDPLARWTTFRPNGQKFIACSEDFRQTDTLKEALSGNSTHAVARGLKRAGTDVGDRSLVILDVS